MSDPRGHSKRFRLRRAHAVVIGRWGDDTALLRRDDGTTVEVQVPEAIRDRIDVGARLDLGRDGVVDWRAAAGSG